MIFTPRLPDIRKQLEIAQLLAKSRVGFVIVPVFTEAEYHVGLVEQSVRLEKIAQVAEAEQNRGGNGG